MWPGKSLLTRAALTGSCPEQGTRHLKVSSCDSWALPLQVYAESILALQHKAHEGGSSNRLPLVIMTSDDTHQRTQQLLESHSFFGLSPKQVHLLKQEKVRSRLRGTGWLHCWAVSFVAPADAACCHTAGCQGQSMSAASQLQSRLNSRFHCFICTGRHAVLDIWSTAAEGRLAAPGTCMCMPIQVLGHF